MPERSVESYSRSYIDGLKPGPELDGLVDLIVMGNPKIKGDRIDIQAFSSGQQPSIVIFDKIGDVFSITLSKNEHGYHCFIYSRTEGFAGEDGFHQRRLAEYSGNNAPEVICKAALFAILSHNRLLKD